MNVQDLERVHATGFDLEDVKVTFNHDVKIKVSDIDVEGKQGEILNIPRWIAKVLEKETKQKEINLEIPPNPELGDYAFPCFSLAKIFKKAPTESS